MPRRIGLTGMAALVATVGCGGEKQEEPEEDPAEHACELRGVAGTPLAAAPETTASVAIAIGETPYAVTLVAGGPSYVAVEAEAEQAALLFLGVADVAQAIWYGADAEPLRYPSPNELCPDEIPEHFDLDFHDAGTYYLELGPAVVGEVWLLLMDASGHVHP